MKSNIAIYHWLPRLIMMGSIAFITVLSLDAFDTRLSPGQMLLNAVGHLAPSLILLSMLVFAWKNEKLGGSIFISAGLVLSPYVFFLNYQRNHFTVMNSLLVVLFVSVPLIVSGVLFLMSHVRKRKVTA